MSTHRGQPATNDGIIRVSASQIKTFRSCARKWGFQKIDKLFEPTTGKQQFGTDVHTHMEDWIKKGINPPSTPEGKTAQQLIRKEWLPSPDSSFEVEKYFKLPVEDGIEIIGYIDLPVPPSWGPLEESKGFQIQPLTSPATIIDYKTSSSSRWAMKAEDLATDPQALIYATFGMQEYKTTVAKARWLYAFASAPKVGPRVPKGARCVEHTFHCTDPVYKEAWAGILETVHEIAHAKRTWKSSNENATPNARACSMYGGCKFADVCEMSPGQRIISQAFQYKREHLQGEGKNILTDSVNSTSVSIKENTMNLSDKLKAMKQAADKGQDPLKMKSPGVNPPPPDKPLPEPEVQATINTLDAVAEMIDRDAAENKKTVGEMIADITTNYSLKELRAHAKSLGLRSTGLPKAALKAAILNYDPDAPKPKRGRPFRMSPEEAATALQSSILRSGERKRGRPAKKDITQQFVPTGVAGEVHYEGESPAKVVVAESEELVEGLDKGAILAHDPENPAKSLEIDVDAMDAAAKGFVPPEMTEEQRANLTLSAGLIVKDADTGKFLFFNGQEWVEYDPENPAVDDKAVDERFTLTDKSGIFKYDGPSTAEVHTEGSGVLSVTTQPGENTKVEFVENPTFMVLIDCIASKGNGYGAPVNLIDLIGDIPAQVALDHNVPHWACIAFESKGQLSSYVDKAFQADPPTGCVLVDSGTLEGMALKSVLIKHASVVVQGVR